MCVTMMNNNEFKAYTPENIKETPNNWKLRSGQGENYCTVDQCFKPGVIEYFKSGKIYDWHVTSGGIFYIFNVLRVVKDFFDDKWEPGEK